MFDGATIDGLFLLGWGNFEFFWRHRSPETMLIVGDMVGVKSGKVRLISLIEMSEEIQIDKGLQGN
jgi:hypothetical protein